SRSRALEPAAGNEQAAPAATDIARYLTEGDARLAPGFEAGATAIYRPTDDHPSGGRWGALKDAFGNRWYIATPKGWTPGPEGLRSVQPYLHATQSFGSRRPSFGCSEIGRAHV